MREVDDVGLVSVAQRGPHPRAPKAMRGHLSTLNVVLFLLALIPFVFAWIATGLTHQAIEGVMEWLGERWPEC